MKTPPNRAPRVARGASTPGDSLAPVRQAFTTKAGKDDPLELLGGRDRVLDLLTQGQDRGSRLSDAFDALSGVPVTQRGLETVLGALLPEAMPCRVTPFQDEYGKPRPFGGGELTVTTRWGNARGRDGFGRTPHGEADRSVLLTVTLRESKSALDLNIEQLSVSPALRSRCFAGRITEGLEALTRVLSPHPRAQLSLAATGMGGYAWAMLGFREPPAYAELSEAFPRWLKRLQKHGRVTSGQVDQLLPAVESAKLPWEIAAVQLPGLTILVEMPGVRTVAPLPVGKAFLHQVSDLLECAWAGERAVHPPYDTTTEVGKAYVRYCLDAAEVGAHRESRSKEWHDRLVRKFLWPSNPELAAVLDRLERLERRDRRPSAKT